MAEEGTTETGAAAPPAGDDLTERIRQVVSETIGSLFDAGARVEDEGGAQKPAPEKPARRRTYRDEEDDMAARVSTEVKRLLAAEKAAGENHPEPGQQKAPPEPVPGKPESAAPRKRRIESFMGW